MEPLTYPDFPRGKSQPERVEILKQATRDAVRECVKDYRELYNQEMSERAREEIEVEYRTNLTLKWHAQRLAYLEEQLGNLDDLERHLTAVSKKVALLSRRLEGER